MADLSKIKTAAKTGKNRFGEPPAPEVNSATLEAPEAAPAETVKSKARAKTNRTTPWGTSVKDDLPKRKKRVAFERDLKMAELLEKWLEAEEKKLGI